MQNNI
jgi:hypothetical protein